MNQTDLERLRADTPGASTCVHLNNAGAGLMPRPVIEAVKEHIDLEAKIGGYEAATHEQERCDQVYDSVAKLIGAKPREIALCENATFAWQMAFYGLDLKAGDRILTARAEYAANYMAFLQRAAKIGCTIEVIPDKADGSTDSDALERMLDERVKLIAITQIPTNGGLINPAAQIGQIANRHGITYLLDACQAVGQMPVDVAQLGCDFLSATGRKFLRGPRGTGFLYVREKWLELLEPPIIDHFGAEWVSHDTYELRPDARRYESWENAYALRLGLGAAVDYALALGLEAISTRAFGLAAQCMLWQTSPAATELETCMLGWLRQMIGLPEGFHGVIQDSASSATLAAILVAREKALSWRGNTVGLAGQPACRIYCSDQVHS